ERPGGNGDDGSNPGLDTPGEVQGIHPVQVAPDTKEHCLAEAEDTGIAPDQSQADREKCKTEEIRIVQHAEERRVEWIDNHPYHKEKEHQRLEPKRQVMTET